MTNDGWSVDDARVAVVKRLRARQDELVRAIFARVSSVAPDPAADDDAEYMAGLRTTVATAVDYVSLVAL